MMESFTSRTSFVFLFLLFATMFNRGICKTNKTIRCNKNDCGLLLIFKQGVVDPLNKLSSWTSQQDCCLWSGVTCDMNGRVEDLDLSNQTFQGGINLSLLQLRFFYLWENMFSADISNVTIYSKYVDLDYNNFTGGLPHLSTNVSEFLASHNSLSGSLSPLLCHPQSNGENMLHTLDLSYNHLTGIIPDCLANWKHLDSRDLQGNKLTGKIPPSMASLNLGILDLDYNNFTGSLPHLSTNVSEFRASQNSLSGSLSPLLCHPQSNGENMLHTLDLSYNHLTRIIPDCLANWKHLDFLDLHGNKLTGKIPPSMASLNLGILDLRDNSFFGKFSLDLSNWTNLQYLLLEGNEFSGSLPTIMPQSLVVIKLRANQFIGEIPLHLCNLSSLMVLDLADNKLSGSIPHCLNNIMVSIDQELRAEILNVYTKGRELDYNNIGLLRIIDLSTNNLSREIPKELLSMNQMWSLNLSWNHLTGKIPREIGGMTNLESLDLSHNKLSGEIPSTISNISFLAWLNLSYNNFYGQIPMGTQIQSFDSWSFVGNLNLCGDPLPKKCNKKEETHNSEPAEENEHDTFLKSLYLGMGVGFAAGFWAVCGSLFLIRAWRHKFFLFFDHMKDQLYVVVALKIRSLREISGTNCC